MPYAKDEDQIEGHRTTAEAWDMALDNKYMLYKLLNAYVAKHSLPYYKGPELLAELESHAWEAFFIGCKRWDESKGFALSTFIYPIVINTLHARMKVLSRMGSSMVGHNKTKGEIHIRPGLSSLEQLDERRGNDFDSFSERNSLRDLFPNATERNDPVSMEDEVIDRLEQEEKTNQIKALVDKMSEPHKTVFSLVFLAKPTHETSRAGESKLLGGGWTLSDVSQKYGRSTTWVKEILDEAIEYIRWQLDLEQGPETNDK